MSSEFGRLLRVSLFGESHGAAVGVLLQGLPAGERVDMQELQAFLSRRSPGRDACASARVEADVPEFISGLREGVTCGTPLCALLRNEDARSEDYTALADIPRPSHADYTAYAKWHGAADMRGGGHFSGRLTAPLCVAGGIALQMLARRGIYVGAHLLCVENIGDDAYPLHPTAIELAAAGKRPFPVLAEAQGALMQQAIAQAAAEGDSLGGIIECAAIGLRAGLGSPIFEGAENRLSQALFGIPALKGVEFGAGFACAKGRGSAYNDEFCMREGRIATRTNHSGGLQGGITNGMPLVLRAAIKPTPSIARAQRSVRLSDGAETTELTISGRHDPCIAPRAVPAVEAAVALVLLDMLLEEQAYGA